MYLLITAVKWLSILFLTLRLQREIRIQARICRNAERNKDAE